MRLTVDKIASATRNVPLRRDVRVGDEIIPRAGYLVAGRVRGEKTVYNQLEDPHGRMVTLHDGDVIVGVLGHRNALHGYSGVVPESVRPGDVLQLLNLGGVIGRCTSENPDLGRPFDVEVLGAVLVFPEFESRQGVSAHIGMNAIACDGNTVPDVPVIYVAGTCMSSGKTSAACRLVRQLSLRGAAVGGCKCTGVSLRRDALAMMDYGARWAVTFTDAGIVTSSPENSAPVARGLIAHLARQGAGVVVAELGDGIFGEYGVQEILADAVLMQRSAAMVLCANDPVGAWGAREVLRDRYGLGIDVVSGPTTDNAVGTRFVREQLGLAAINARTHGHELGALIADKLNGRLKRSVA
ncbi:MAG: hypothetical protein HUU22_15420 [Phycisphaerae bacterium]|nr:hypothetical protein [Phycisphaerae bacterium]NUQ47414.1 hypothetical protein [Phycisphaerae bacterium]